MYIRSTFTVSELWIHPAVPIASSVHQALGVVSVVVRAPTDEEVSKGHLKENAFLEATVELSVTDELAAAFDALERGELADGSRRTAENASLWDMQVSEQGTLRPNQAPRLELMPPDFRDFVAEIGQQLNSVGFRYGRILRWRTAVDGPPSPFRSRGMEWSRDGQLWNPLPGSYSISMSFSRALRCSGNVVDEIAALVESGADEPLGHQMRRESLSSRANWRSAIVIGVAAAETSVKQLIVKTVPQSGWLVTELQSPSLFRILREYLPTLFGQGAAPVRKWLLTDINRAVKLRNQVVHGRSQADPPADLDRLLRACGDEVWLCDAYGGYDWALENVTDTA